MFCAVNKQKRTSIGEVVVSVLPSSRVFTGKTLIKSSSPKTSPCRLPYCPSVTFSSSSFSTFPPSPPSPPSPPLSPSLSLTPPPPPSIDRLCLSTLWSVRFAPAFQRSAIRSHWWKKNHEDSTAGLSASTKLSHRSTMPNFRRDFFRRVTTGFCSAVSGSCLDLIRRFEGWLPGSFVWNDG